ncbi:MAG: hypothetical protein ACREM1_00525, partial [Longimicrobiales bacterium]
GGHSGDTRSPDESQSLDHNHGRYRMRTLVSVAAAALLAGGPAHAQDITGEIDEIFSWVTPNSPGCVGVVSAVHRNAGTISRSRSSITRGGGR